MALLKGKTKKRQESEVGRGGGNLSRSSRGTGAEEGRVKAIPGVSAREKGGK